MRRRRRLGPRQLNLITILCFLGGGLLAGIAGYDRAALDPSMSLGIAALLRFLSFLLVVSGAILSVRVLDILLLFDEARARRRALASLVGGIAAILFSCVLLSMDGQTEAARVADGFGQGSLIAGIGIFLAGFIGSLWVFGGSYAAERIERLNEEDW